MIMNMEDFTGLSNDQTIAKGKRTKRPRPSSSASSSGKFCNSLSPSTSSISGVSTCTEEDEDMANCLILLAHGGSPSLKATKENNKFITRKFTEMAAKSRIGKVGIYVYECKTCDRTFPSFQALGGHRTSHKKPKTSTTVDIDRKKSPIPNPEPIMIPSPSSRIDHNKTTKIHECSICGSEFASGQALGGHMRRHRSSMMHNDTKPRNIMLTLDLNLPAPEDIEKYDQFSISKRQRNVVFSSSPALVDCHY